MNFRPTKWKVIVSILAIVLWLILSNFYNGLAMCKECVPPQCDVDYGNWVIVKPSCSGCFCQSFSEMISSNLLNILIPFILVYVTWSLIQKNPKNPFRRAEKG